MGYDGGMAEEPKIDVYKNGHMFASCNEEDFAAIRQAICDRLGYTESVEHVRDVRVADRSKLRPRQPSRLRDKVALVGCGVVAFILCVGFATGIYSIIQMFRK